MAEPRCFCEVEQLVQTWAAAGSHARGVRPCRRQRAGLRLASGQRWDERGAAAPRPGAVDHKIQAASIRWVYAGAVTPLRGLTTCPSGRYPHSRPFDDFRRSGRKRVQVRANAWSPNIESPSAPRSGPQRSERKGSGRRTRHQSAARSAGTAVNQAPACDGDCDGKKYSRPETKLASCEIRVTASHVASRPSLRPASGAGDACRPSVWSKMHFPVHSAAERTPGGGDAGPAKRQATLPFKR